MKLVEITAFEFTNGDLLIGCTGKKPHRMFFIKTSDGIFEYSEDEVDEIYKDLIPDDTNLVAIKTKG